MARCNHSRGNIQQITEVCLDCGRNIYESDDDYEESLRKDIDALRRELKAKKIDDLEKVKRELEEKLGKRKEEDDYSGW